MKENKTHRKGLVQMTKKEIMKEAHRIAREKLEGDYQAKLALALKMVWRKQKEGNKMKVELNVKKGTVKVDGEKVIEDVRVADGMSSRKGFDKNERVEKPEPWIKIYEVSEERFEEVASKFEKIEWYKEALEEAKETGEKAKYYAYTEDCIDHKEECDIDKVFKYVTPEGKVETKRVHTH